jgi:hypothetical protein
MKVSFKISQICVFSIRFTEQSFLNENKGEKGENAQFRQIADADGPTHGPARPASTRTHKSARRIFSARGPRFFCGLARVHESNAALSLAIAHSR